MLLPVAQRQRHGLERRLRTDERGVALVEFALVLPLMMLLLFGAVEFGKAFTMWIDETHLANAAARYAAVNSYRPDPSGPTVKVDANVGAFEDFIEADGDTQELRDSFSDASKPLNGVRVCFPSGTGEIGDAVRIDVQATYSFLGFFPVLSGDKDLRAHSVMRIESTYDPTVAADPANACP